MKERVSLDVLVRKGQSRRKWIPREKMVTVGLTIGGVSEGTHGPSPRKMMRSLGGAHPRFCVGFPQGLGYPPPTPAPAPETSSSRGISMAIPLKARHDRWNPDSSLPRSPTVSSLRPSESGVKRGCQEGVSGGALEMFHLPCSRMRIDLSPPRRFRGVERRC